MSRCSNHNHKTQLYNNHISVITVVSHFQVCITLVGSHCIGLEDHRVDLSLKLASAELVEVSWLIFMEESDTETSDDRVDLEDDNSDRDVDMAGDSIGSGPYSAKYGCARA